MTAIRTNVEPALRRPVPIAAVARGSFARDAWLVLGGCLLSVALLTVVFPPISIWPVAFLALAPWAAAICTAHRAWVVHWLSFAAGFAFFLWNLRWMIPVTGAGYVALSAYLALYWPLVAWAIRTGRRFGVSAVWALPVAWVASEFLRAWVMSGFPWLLLAHAFYQQTTWIQISDFTGAYGVSFLAALVSGTACELLLACGLVGRVQALPRQLWAGVLASALLPLGVVGYGVYRLGQADAIVEGPRVAVVQHDFIQVNHPPYAAVSDLSRPAPREYVFAECLAVGAQAAAKGADLIVFPETSWSSNQNIDFIEQQPLQAVDELDPRAYSYARVTHEATAAFARGDYRPVNDVISEWEARFRRIAVERPQSNYPTHFARLPPEGPAAALVVGAIAVETFPGSTDIQLKKYNSALVYDADGRQRRQRYDKNHLVPFGEFVPFRRQHFLGIDLHPLYTWLNGLSPFSESGKVEYSLWRGHELTVFGLQVGGKQYRFGTPICYEDVMPRVIRRYVWDGSRRRVDFLTNISNDGWFLHSAELPQHLSSCVFRAVENRVSIARAVNTGVSGFIDSHGRIVTSLGPGQIGFLTTRIPIDSRISLYGLGGDWLAGACLVLSTGAWCSAMFTRWVLGAQRRLARWRRKRGS